MLICLLILLYSVNGHHAKQNWHIVTCRENEQSLKIMIMGIWESNFTGMPKPTFTKFTLYYKRLLPKIQY